MNVELAYQRCEEITRREAKNFSYGIRLLRPPERRALSAVYALARRIDDIGDGSLPTEDKLVALKEVRSSLDGPPGEDPVLVAIAHARDRYPLPMAAFGELIDGCEQDVRGARYDSLDDLVGYCRLVAGSVGRLSLAVFGCAQPDRARPLADDLGVALQLTNILRDVMEDRGMGRVYLPGADLASDATALGALVAGLCPEAARWFDRGLQLLPLLDRRSRACVGAMAGIYRRLLVRISRDPMAVTRGRVALSTQEKAWVAARAVLGARP